MNDMIINAAQDPSCILAVTPDRGGSWWAALRPDTPRNFDDVPAAWYDAVSVGYAAIGDHDCEFEISYKNNVDYPGTIFYSNSQAGSINLHQIENNPNYFSSFRAFDEQYPSLRIPIDAGVQNAGSHIVKFKRQNGTAEAWVDGVLVNSLTSKLGNKPLYADNVPASHFDGNIFYIRLTDLTTGETVWQASRDDLFETNNPWPSPVPENYAENARAFYDCQAVVQEVLDPTHDYSFLIEAEIVRENPECSVFYAGGDKFPFGVYNYSDNTIRVFSNLLRSATDTSSKYATVIAYSGDTRLQGRHTLESRIEGDAMHVFLDGNEIEHPYVFARTGLAAVGLPQCNSGYVYKIQIEDLTTGKTVWSYPSEAERVRLLTKTNVRTDRGVFEAADETKISGISTMLDLRGNTTSKTFVARAFCPAHDPASGKLYIHPFFLQGAIQQGTSLYTFQFSLWEDRRSGRTTQLFPTISIGTDSPGANVTGAEIYLDQWHTYAMVIDYNGGNCYIRAFVDGVLLRERTISGTPAWNTPAATTAQETTVGIRRDPNASYYAGSLTRISAALIFDRALTAAEIAALTPTNN